MLLPQDATTFHYTPASGLQRWVNVFGTGFGFIHAV
jgi:uncharacterized protein YgfB (UPF0149 family)